MTAHATEPDPGRPAAELGYADAVRTVTAQHSAGVSLDEISVHHHDVSARLFSDAQTGPGRAYAEAYSATSEALVADLADDQARARGVAPMAARLPDGTPHADPRLAAHGWQAEGGVYVRKSARAISPGKSAATAAERKESTMTSHEAQQPSEYDMAMGRNPAGEKSEDERYASGSHREELTGSLAKARDAHARAEIDRAAAGYRERQADREAGA